MRRTGAVRAAGGSGEGSAAVRRDGGERGSKGTAVQLRGDAWTAVRAARGEGDVMDTLESLRAELADARARLAEALRMAAEDAAKASAQKQAFFERLTTAEKRAEAAEGLLREARTVILTDKAAIPCSWKCAHEDCAVLARIDTHLSAKGGGQ
jgi:hypothetical protein